jgi:hypothetical protein
LTIPMACMAGRELEQLRGSHSFSIVGMDGGRISRDTVLSTNIFLTNILRKMNISAFPRGVTLAVTACICCSMGGENMCRWETLI